MAPRLLRPVPVLRRLLRNAAVLARDALVGPLAARDRSAYDHQGQNRLHDAEQDTIDGDRRTTAPKSRVFHCLHPFLAGGSPFSTIAPITLNSKSTKKQTVWQF